MEKKCNGWYWGDAEITPKGIVFNTNQEGGYECKFCGLKLSKRRECIRVHIVRFHKEKNVNTKSIPSLKEKCQYCQKPIDPHLPKQVRHYWRVHQIHYNGHEAHLKDDVPVVEENCDDPVEEDDKDPD